jgi:hypothetical protein
MRVFKVKLVSQINIILTLLLWLAILTPFFILRIKFLPTSLGTDRSIAFTIPAVVLLFILLRKLATAKSEWSITDTAIELNWVNNYAFVKAKGFSIPWTLIQNVDCKWQGNYDRLKISLTSGNKLSFYHDPLIWKDDFDDLISALETSATNKSLAKYRLRNSH